MGPLSRGLLLKFLSVPFIRRSFYCFLSSEIRLAWLNRRIRFGQIYHCSSLSTYHTLARDLDFILVSHFSYTKNIGPRVGDLVLLIEPKRTDKLWARMLSPGRAISSCITGFEGYCGSMRAGRRELPDSKVIVPRGHCWAEALGSAYLPDSRLFGPVPLASLLGKLIWRLEPQRFYFLPYDPQYGVRSTSQRPIATRGQPARPDADPRSPVTQADLLSRTIHPASTGPKAQLRYSVSRIERQASINRSSSKKT